MMSVSPPRRSASVAPGGQSEREGSTTPVKPKRVSLVARQRSASADAAMQRAQQAATTPEPRPAARKRKVPLVPHCAVVHGSRRQSPQRSSSPRPDVQQLQEQVALLQHQLHVSNEELLLEQQRGERMSLVVDELRHQLASCRAALREAATSPRNPPPLPVPSSPPPPRVSPEEEAQVVWRRFVMAVRQTGLTERELLCVTNPTLRGLVAHVGMDRNPVDLARIEVQWRLLNEKGQRARSPSMDRSPSRTPSPSKMTTGTAVGRSASMDPLLPPPDFVFTRDSAKPVFSTRRALGDRTKAAKGMSPVPEDGVPPPPHRRQLSPGASNVVTSPPLPPFWSPPASALPRRDQHSSPRRRIFATHHNTSGSFDRVIHTNNQPPVAFKPSKGCHDTPGSPRRGDMYRSADPNSMSTPSRDALMVHRPSRCRSKSPDCMLQTTQEKMKETLSPFTGKRMAYEHRAKDFTGVPDLLSPPRGPQ